MRKLLVGVAGLVILIIAAAVIIPLAIPVTTFEGRLNAFVRQATGREIKIAGPVKLSLLPTLELEARDVSFANAPDARAPDMVRSKQLRMRLQLWPLFHGSVVVSSLVLVEPIIALEVDRAGNPNWVFRAPVAPSSPSPLAAEKPPTAGGSLGISSLRLAEVRLVDGKISYIDQRTGEGQRIGNIDMTLSLNSLASPLTAGGTAVWGGERVDFALGIDQPRALLAGGESQASIKLAAAAMTLDFSGRVAGLPSARLTGLIDLKTQSVRQVAKWMGSPITFAGGGFGPLAIKGAIVTAGPKTSISDASLSLDAINSKGWIAIDRVDARPLLTGKLDVDKLDLNPYLSPEAALPERPVAAADPVPAPASVARSDRNDLSIDASPLKIADLDVDLQVGGIAYRKFQTGASTARIRVKDGRFTSDLTRMALYRGSGRGSVTVDDNGTAPGIGLNMTLAQVQIAPLAQAMIDNNRLTGTGNLNIAVTARGSSQRELINTLSGSGALSLANGQIEGVNLPALAESAAKIERDIVRTLDISDTLNLLAHGQINKIGPLALVENAAKSLVGGRNASNFATLTATCSITNGVVRNNDLQARLGGVPMTGAGTVDLRTNVVDYRVNVRLAESIVVPIQVSGTWDNLSYRSDVPAMLTQTPRNVLEILKSAGGSVGKGIEGVGQGALGVLKGIFGK